MPIPGVPRSVEAQVLDAVIAQLKGHPATANRRVIKTWLPWDGKADVSPPEVGSMPACMVRLVGGPVKAIAGARAIGGPMRKINESRPSILIDLFTSGTDQGDVADVAGQVMLALSPDDAQQRASMFERFRRAGIKSIQLTRQILPASAESFQPEGIWASGSYELTVHSYA